MATKRWRSRICRECGGVVRLYWQQRNSLGWKFRTFIPNFCHPIHWCRTCQRKLGIGDWIWGNK